MKIYAMPGPKKQDLSTTEFVRIHDYHMEAPESWSVLAGKFTKKLFLTGPRPIKIVHDTACGPEHYKMTVAQDRIVILCGGEHAFRYAMEMILSASDRSLLPVGTIEDYPMLSMRGYQLNLASCLRYCDLDELFHFIRMCSQVKINTILIESGNRFPNPKYPSGNPWELTTEEYRRLMEYIRAEGMDVIPMLQTFGHLSNMLSDPGLAYLREEQHLPEQLCPMHPGAMPFVKDVVDLYIEMHPHSKYFHIGGDETRQLGICPKCAEYAAKHGKGGLYTYHMNKVIDYVCSRGLIPMIYDDMVCAHPEAIRDLDRRAVIVYWDYWTTTDPTPLLVARGANPDSIIVHDRFHRENGYRGIGDLERNILKDFSGCLNMEKELSKEYIDLYRPYLGKDFPKMMKALPYLEYYQDCGFKVVTMPTTLGNTDNYLGAPNQARFTSNICLTARRTVEARAEGMISSTWYPYPEAGVPFGIGIAGQYAWGMPEGEKLTLPGTAASV